MRVAILLCTYNGSRFLREQLNSLLAQCYSEWVCYVFDDCSRDDTQEILSEYARRYPERFVVTVNSEPSGSASKNFIAATDYAYRNLRFDLLCYCDQDDVWNFEKLTTLVDVFRKHQSPKPLLAFSDLIIVDDRLKVRYSSFVEHLSVGGYSRHVQRGLIVVDNIIPGCALMCNRALIETALPFPEDAVMHDWWLVNVAFRKGTTVFVQKPLMLYRQHQHNVIGARRLTLLGKLRRSTRVLRKVAVICKMARNLYPDQSRLTFIYKYAFVKLYKFVHYH